ncbi:MAG: hypothetical protein N838_27615, partial [Thiohalocapsa sp. PB-PSB1]
MVARGGEELEDDRMNCPQGSVGEVLSRLQEEGLIDNNQQNQAVACLSRLDDEMQPWYLRTLIGFSAWFSSLLLLGFVLEIGLVDDEVGYIALGLGLLLAAIVLSRVIDNDFSNQTALACNLAGQCLLVIGIAGTMPGDEFKMALVCLILLNALLIPLYSDRVFRTLAPMIMVAAMVALLYAYQVQAVLPLVVPALAALFLWMVSNEDWFSVNGHDQWARPLMAGLLLGLFGCTLLSTVYVLPELADRFEFYPRPWLSTLGIGLLLLYAEYRFLCADVFGGFWTLPAISAYGMTTLILLATLPAPGIGLSVMIMLLGTARGSPTMAGAGIG